MAEVAEIIERNLILLGATGIEDKLQDVRIALPTDRGEEKRASLFDV